jgi:hypothetical protein
MSLLLARGALPHAQAAMELENSVNEATHLGRVVQSPTRADPVLMAPLMGQAALGQYLLPLPKILLAQGLLPEELQLPEIQLAQGLLPEELLPEELQLPEIQLAQGPLPVAQRLLPEELHLPPEEQNQLEVPALSQRPAGPADALPAWRVRPQRCGTMTIPPASLFARKLPASTVPLAMS